MLTSGTNRHGVSVILTMQIPTKRISCILSAVSAALIGIMQPLAAAELTISVLDPSGHGVAGVVLVAEPEAAVAGKHPARTTIMDQQNMQFVPNIVVVQTGGGVEFPNSDQIEHQVYSFSAAKTFQLSLYAGHKYPPVIFDRPGLVVVGCNIALLRPQQRQRSIVIARFASRELSAYGLASAHAGARRLVVADAAGGHRRQCQYGRVPSHPRAQTIDRAQRR
jgi:plastocyanin